jgi:hypothetical protein
MLLNLQPRCGWTEGYTSLTNSTEVYLGLKSLNTLSEYIYMINKTTKTNTDKMFRKNSRFESKTLTGTIIVSKPEEIAVE